MELTEREFKIVKSTLAGVLGVIDIGLSVQKLSCMPTRVHYLFQGHSTSGESASPDDTAQHNGKTGGEDSEDILAALEKVQGVGSLRSLYSVGSSQPSLTLDARAVRREESSHSISSGLSLGLVRIAFFIVFIV